ncbi:phosphate ABC transporter permease subunit PstC [Reyranella sp. CPCC 100927]|uniref:phosphate ABC transporter permease subunit PstC n=1 Tax=Reyranella sp. CPCC 100927 TaxID=2599616 RepID=UPI0011B5F5F4|nr:phosphate ABC transporter permease subunit PstC [Reyranella sp. CPCC 100927]TWS95701.1 phosphate ABC transporter permease subunit PstC [Reyranella sp. CPCC 100927]
MSSTLVLAALLLMMLASFAVGRQRALATADGHARTLHSRPPYYGTYVAMWAAVPALLLLALWVIAQPTVIDMVVRNSLPDDVRTLSSDKLSLVLTTIDNLANGRAVVGEPPAYAKEAAARLLSLRATSSWAMTVLVIGLAAVGFFFAWRKVNPALRARNDVERAAVWLLIACSAIAILTTVGIVFSMLFETLHFFSMVPPQDFFFGTVWDPRFTAVGRDGSAGQFGLIPLLWGTIFISLISMLVAVPIGLLSAIYLSEYAHKNVRAWVKPLLEILAGIPTVVYGFFALTTLGPLFRDLGASVGLDISATSALTAGVVMGVMIIPFVSSLSDDIINAVPQSLRDGSYALGATQSETIKRVVFPAALPGIVGSVLLAVSRAIGETMIVVMAAGIAAKMTLNPFDSVTTVTVKIVSQLTGDLEFNSPQTLVAFALGLTLFVVTLGLNIYALHIVRKYREQYD